MEIVALIVPVENYTLFGFGIDDRLNMNLNLSSRCSFGSSVKLNITFIEKFLSIH